MRFAVDLEFHLPLDDHDELVGVVYEIRPDLARGVHPEAAGKAAAAPVGGDGGGVNACAHGRDHAATALASQRPSRTGGRASGVP